MIEDKGNIEELFRTSLGEYEVKPSSRVWEGINQEVQVQTGKSKPFLGKSTWFIMTVCALTVALFWENNVSYTATAEKFIPKEQVVQKKMNRLAIAVVKEERSNISKVIHNISQLKDSKTNSKKEFYRDTHTVKQLNGLDLKTSELTKADKIEDLNKKRATALLPKEVFQLSESKGCKPLVVNFRRLVELQSVFVWDINKGIQSNSKNASHTYTEAGTYPVSLTITNQKGEETIYTDTIVVFDTPIANCDVSMNSSTQNTPIYFYNYSENTTSCTWLMDDSLISLQNEPIKFVNELIGTSIKLKVWSKEGCEDSVVIANPINQKSDLFIRFPNAFTPDPSGPNTGRYYEINGNTSVFHPVSKGVVEYKLEIYNRQGIQIFKSEDILIGWNGYYDDNLAKQDAYIWKVLGTYSDGTTFVERGDVLLLRK